MFESPGGYHGDTVVAILVKERPSSSATSGNKSQYPYFQTPCSRHCSDGEYMSQSLTIFFSRFQRSLKHEFCVVVVCVPYAYDDSIEATMPVNLPLCRLLAYFRLGILALVWDRTPN
jgi:hypothetical protein